MKANVSDELHFYNRLLDQRDRVAKVLEVRGAGASGRTWVGAAWLTSSPPRGRTRFTRSHARRSGGETRSGVSADDFCFARRPAFFRAR
jgi:hypothetical protein